MTAAGSRWTDPVGRVPLRIGHAERASATAALDAHLAAGRLDAEEYGERAAHISLARTREDITPLFADLPDPQPFADERSVPAAGRHSGASHVPGLAWVAARSYAPARRSALVAAVLLALVVARTVLLVGFFITWHVTLLIIALGTVFVGRAVRRAAREQRRRRYHRVDSWGR